MKEQEGLVKWMRKCLSGGQFEASRLRFWKFCLRAMHSGLQQSKLCLQKLPGRGPAVRATPLQAVELSLMRFLSPKPEQPYLTSIMDIPELAFLWVSFRQTVMR